MPNRNGFTRVPHPPSPPPRGERDLGWGEALLALRRVLSGELRCRAVEPLLLSIQSSLSAPRALQIVSHVEAQLAEAFRLQLDQVSVLKAAQPAMVGARGEDV